MTTFLSSSNSQPSKPTIMPLSNLLSTSFTSFFSDFLNFSSKNTTKILIAASVSVLIIICITLCCIKHKCQNNSKHKIPTKNQNNSYSEDVENWRYSHSNKSNTLHTNKPQNIHNNHSNESFTLNKIKIINSNSNEIIPLTNSNTI